MEAWDPLLKWAIASLGLLTVAVLLGWYFRRRASAGDHGDPGFLKDLGDWPAQSFPLLLVDGDPGMREIAREFMLAAQWWNDQTELRLFAVSILESGRTVPIMPAILGGAKAMKVNFRQTGTKEIFSAAIVVDLQKWVSIDKRQRIRACRHELGHLLRLAHDNDPESVMYPDLTPTEPPKVSKMDLERLAVHFQGRADA